IVSRLLSVERVGGILGRVTPGEFGLPGSGEILASWRRSVQPAFDGRSKVIRLALRQGWKNLNGFRVVIETNLRLEVFGDATMISHESAILKGEVARAGHREIDSRADPSKHAQLHELLAGLRDRHCAGTD